MCDQMKKGILLIISFFFIEPAFAYSQNIDHKIAIWTKKIEQEIKKDSIKKENFEDVDTVKRKLRSLVEFDQQFRNEFSADLENSQLPELFFKIDKHHTDILKRILAIHVWVNISKFGKEADHNAWLLVQHADQDLFFQAGVAFILQQLVLLGETNKANYAYLYDRVALKLARFDIKQRYGTQAFIEEGKIKISPYEGSIQSINKNRAEMGLESMHIYLQKLKTVYQL